MLCADYVHRIFKVTLKRSERIKEDTKKYRTEHRNIWQRLKQTTWINENRFYEQLPVTSTLISSVIIIFVLFSSFLFVAWNWVDSRCKYTCINIVQHKYSLKFLLYGHFRGWFMHFQNFCFLASCFHAGTYEIAFKIHLNSKLQCRISMKYVPNKCNVCKNKHTFICSC